MTKSRKQLYEGMYILSATLSEDARQKAIDKITSGITERGGTIKKMHDWGRRKLAYEINSKKEGYYFILYFDAPALIVNDLWKDYHLNEDLMRFVTLRTDKVMDKIEFKQLAEV